MTLHGFFGSILKFGAKLKFSSFLRRSGFCFRKEAEDEVVKMG